MKRLIAVILIVMLLLCSADCGKNVPDIEDEQHGTNELMGKEENPGEETGTTEVTPPVEEQNPEDPGEEAKEPEGAKEPEEAKEPQTPAKEPENKQQQNPGQQQGQTQTGPKDGDTKIENGQKYVYDKWMGWIEDHRGEGGGGATVWDGPSELSGNKVGVM